MQEKSIIQISQESLEKLIGILPFYKDVKLQDNWQYELLLQHSRVVTYSPKEVVLQKGEKDRWLCFLLKGELTVLAGPDNQPVNTITPGEVFGDLAMVLKQERSATVVVADTCREVVVFATDFSLFGELEDVHRITLMTKLIYYRNLLLSLRWKLEVYRNNYPDHELANQHRTVKLYVGPRDTLEELISLDGQAVKLGRLLLQWNEQFGRISELNEAVLDSEVLESISL
jgi:CRP-like cAMP-binding protein